VHGAVQRIFTRIVNSSQFANARAQAMDLKSGYPYWTVRDGLVAAFPPLSRDLDCDVAVIGAGITGALIARELQDAGLDVVVLDRRDAGWGSTAASTALLQYEIDPGLVGIAKRYGERKAVAMLKACEAVIDAIGDLARNVPGSDYLRAESLYYASWPWHARAVREEGERRLAAGFSLDILERDALRERFGIDASVALLTHVAAEIDPYRTALGILRTLVRDGGAVFDRTEVTAIEATSRRVVLRTDRDARVTCGHVVVAGGYESARFLSQRVSRNHSTYVLVTEPIAHLPAWTRRTLVWESARPYLYVRSAGDSRLIVGGENDLVDLPAKRDRAVPRKAARLRKKLGKLLGRDDIETGFTWAGTFAETEDGLPFFGPHRERGPRVHFAMAYGGNGIAYSVIGAELIRRRILRESHPLARFLSFDRLH
jgi:glycine/D-amino acid oxidase-like deaminating enzyme